MTARIVVTAGDPTGIGPEVAAKALAGFEQRDRVILIGEAAALRSALARHAPGLDVQTLELGELDAGRPGEVSPAGGAAALATLDTGVAMLRAGRAAAIVTGPIHKGAVRAAGHARFEGHTEYLAERLGAPGDVAMLLDSPRLRVVHVSTHRALRSAVELDATRIDRVVDLACAYLERIGASAPRVVVAGLNPHAGEHGAFGSEERETIGPAVRRARERHPGVDFAGPIAPDSCFAAVLDAADTIVVAMYHDQGHIPVKLIARDSAVNITLGLPFVRTSVDHGTAHDIAGRGVASPLPMVAALDAALRLTDSQPQRGAPP